MPIRSRSARPGITLFEAVVAVTIVGLTSIAALEASGAPKAVRFKVPPGQTRFKDLVHGDIVFDNANIEDFVILRSDGQPTYHLSVVVDDVDMVIRQFQNMTQAIKFSQKPVVVAPFGLTLGGGTEMSLHAAARQPHAELYTGLVEVGVGLLPGGGGCKEMLLRAVDSAAAIRKDGRGESVEMMEAMKRAFETVATAKVATSAHEARGLGFLSDSDRISMNRERVLSDAKARALELAQTGYEPPPPRMDIPAPGESILAALKMGVHLMRQGEFISDHEVKIGTKVAEVLCGGNVSPGTPVSEQYILDLEREAFKSLCGERKTQERIQYTLKTGKTLRN